MEPNKKLADVNSILNLLGDLTDFKSDSNIEESEIETINIEKGDFVEKYFNQKLKYQLDAKEAFSIYLDVGEIKNDLILSINYALLNDNSKLKKDIGLQIINKIIKCLKDETCIQIDSFLPIVSGEKLSLFFQTINQYSYPAHDKIDPQKNYTIIGEITYSLRSQIGENVNQLRKSFILFSLINDLYIKYPQYVENYYKYFILRYFKKKKTEKKSFDSEDIKKIELSPYGNYVFLIVSNKTLKKFQETIYDIENSTFDEKKINDNSLKKFYKEDESLLIKPQNNIKVNEKQKPKFKHFQEMKFLIYKINQNFNYSAKLLYLDSYLNLVTPKCVMAQKLNTIKNDIIDLKNDNEKLKKNNEKLEKNIEKLKKENEEIKKILKDKFPELQLFDLKD